MNTTPATVPKPLMVPGRIIKEGHDKPLWEQPNGIVRVLFQDAKSMFRGFPGWAGRRVLMSPITIIDVLSIISLFGWIIWIMPWAEESFRNMAKYKLTDYYESVARRSRRMRQPHPHESQGLLAWKRD